MFPTIFLCNLSLFAGFQVPSAYLVCSDVPTHDGRPLDDWVKDLDSADEKVQHAAILAVKAMGPKAKSAVPRLIDVLKAEPKQGSQSYLYNETADALGAIGPDAKEAVPALLARLKAEKRSVRYAVHAGDALALIDGPNQDATRALLLELNPRCGGRLLFFAQYPVKNPGETVRQIIALTQDKDVTVRQLAIQALGGPDELAGISQFKPSALVAKAGPAAKEIPDVLEKLLADPSPVVRKAAIESLVRVAPDRADKAVVATIRALRAGEFNHKKVVPGWLIANMLQPIAEKSFDSFVPLLDDANDSIRYEAMNVLGHFRLIPQLERTLREGKSAKIRSGAARAMIVASAAMSLPALSTAATDDKEFEVRYAAALAIVTFARLNQAAPALPPLIEALSSESADRRREAAYTIGRIPQIAGKAVPLLKERTRDEDQGVRVAAAVTLVAINRSDAVEAIGPLTEALEPNYVGYRPGMALVLANIGAAAKPAVPTLKKWYDSPDFRMRAQAAEAVARIDPEQSADSVQVLVEMLTLKDRKALGSREYAVESLQRLGPAAKPAVSALCENLKDPMKATANCALAIISIDPSSAKPAIDWIHEKLKKGRQDDDANDIVREMAKLGPKAKPLLPELIVLLKSPEEYFRSSAIRVLRQIGPDAAEALPALREAAESDNSQNVRRQAAGAVKMIDAK